MEPPHRSRSKVKCVSNDPVWTERRRLLLDFCKDIEEKARLIPFSNVDEKISMKLADQLAYPTPLRTDRWMNLVAKLGYPDMCLIAKLKNFECWPDSAFFLFLTRIFAPKGGTLWQLVDALSEEKYTDVLELAKPDIHDFVSKYALAAACEVKPAPVGQYSLDSGFNQSMSSHGSSPSHQNGARLKTSTYVCSPVQNVDVLLAPKMPDYNLDFLKSQNTTKSGSVEEKDLFWPKKDPFSMPDFSYDADQGDYFDFKSLFEKKSSTSINVFISHTQDEEDELKAEELARNLEYEYPEYNFKTYLLKNFFHMVNLDVPSFVMEVMENMDFVVPLLSRTYLEEILPFGDTNEMTNERLVLRYIHVVSQTRVINMNSLNYLIRPIMLHDVNPGMVRKWHEFKCAHKYPEHLGRFAKILKDTKEIVK